MGYLFWPPFERTPSRVPLKETRECPGVKGQTTQHGLRETH